jgi:hypothetical protein
MLKENSYGYPGPDVCVPLRLALEVSSDDKLFYDVTDLIDDPYPANEDFLELARSFQSPTHGSRSQTIVLTEGPSDRRILADSIDLLYPHFLSGHLDPANDGHLQSGQRERQVPTREGDVE